MIAIEVTHLSYVYPDGHHALEDITLTVEKGECLGMVGPNGAGKSTLLMHFNGLLLGNAGDVHILGQPINKQNLSWVRQKVGLVFQNPDDQLFCPTLFDDVSFGPLNSQMPAKEIPGRVAAALRKVGLAGYEDRSPHHMSVGEKRKASLATILSMDPEIIVLDEPSSNLDPRSRRELIDLLASFPQTRIIATHDLDLVLHLCNRVVMLDQGKVATSGKPGDVLTDESLLKAHGLELPDIVRLIEPQERKKYAAKLRT